MRTRAGRIIYSLCNGCRASFDGALVGAFVTEIGQAVMSAHDATTVAGLAVCSLDVAFLSSLVAERIFAMAIWEKERIINLINTHNDLVM